MFDLTPLQWTINLWILGVILYPICGVLTLKTVCHMHKTTPTEIGEGFPWIMILWPAVIAGYIAVIGLFLVFYPAMRIYDSAFPLTTEPEEEGETEDA